MLLWARPEDAQVFDPAAARLEIAAHLRAQSSDTLTLPVWLRAPKDTSGPGWLHAARLPPEAAEAPAGVAAKPPNARGEPRARPRCFWPVG
ncbi:hypothetical protein [Thiocystis violacea]|uniref:hypothetical protein n=1 Tax=Thiocystis violacea TaxID=13725 RepID=UPI001905EFB0|nr:hypothetical protein [Thiocystis violacea]MBK1723943.1 hypothetical protein [Thiocystis violacea]